VNVVHAVRFGGPEVLEVAEAADPVADPGCVVVDVADVDVLTIDAQIRAGQAQQWFETRPPYVPGAGIAGTVSDVGPGVEDAWCGCAVVADTPNGGYVERVAVAADALIAVPEGVALDVAAALLHDGRTALGLMEVTTPEPNEWVLVIGAAGGLGALLVQLCRAGGAHVIGAARGTDKLRLAADLGAEAVVDYSEPGWVEQCRSLAGGAGVGVIFDGVGGEIGTAAFAAMAIGGRFSAHGAAAGGFAAIDPQRANDRAITLTGIERVQFDAANAKRLSTLALDAAAAGSVDPVIGQRFALDQAADAHRAIENRQVIGKTLLEVAA